MVNVTWREPRRMPVKRPGQQAEESLPEGAEPLQQWQLEVRLQRAGGSRAGTSAARVYAPRFPKACCCIRIALTGTSQASSQGPVEEAGLPSPRSRLKGLAQAAKSLPLQGGLFDVIHGTG